MSDDETAARRRLSAAETVVVKVGTNALSNADDTLDAGRVASLAGELADLRDAGRRVVLVTSGAVGAGLDVLGLSARPDDLPRLQAAAAAGQARLIGIYDEAFRRRGTHAAQVLVTGNDFKQRSRYLNVRNTLRALFGFGVVPVVNENDTVSVDEIRFGDNDRLAALVAGQQDNAALVLLTAVEGVLDGPPGGRDSRRVPYAADVDAVRGHASTVRSSRGSGGMHAKLEAVRQAAEAGVAVAIADGRRVGVLGDLFAGGDVGTMFPPAETAISSWKRWIAHAGRPAGTLRVDAGAERAVREGGKSLLAVGVVSVDGTYERGDVVRICSASGDEFARGLTNYPSDDSVRIAGLNGEAIVVELGERPYRELVHRDNLVLNP